MTNETLGAAAKAIPEMTYFDFVSGILAHLSISTFSEQTLLHLLKEIQDADPQLAKPFEITSIGRRLVSPVLHVILGNLEIGQIVEPSQPNPVDQFYRIRPTQIGRRRKSLVRAGILPQYKEIFRSLAERLADMQSCTVSA